LRGGLFSNRFTPIKRKMPYTLLLADDSVTIQRVIELTFADEDVQVVAVGDGDQAIARLDAAPPDIVLADVGMPGRSGYEVARHVKDTPSLAHIPVVLLTGAFEPIDQAKATEVGCDGVLAKPFEPQLVIGRVRELLAKPKRVSASIDDRRPLASSHRATPSLVPPPLPGAASKAPAPAKVDNYFDRLDQALANGTGAPQPEHVKPSAPLPSARDEIDWFGSHADETDPPEVSDRWDVSAPPPSSYPSDPPLSYGSAQVGFDRGSALRPAAVEPAAPPTLKPVASTKSAAAVAPAFPTPLAPTPRPPAPPHTLPPLADAFAALLAAERSAPPPSTAPGWPSPEAVVAEEVIEQVTRRVLDHLSDRVVRETVAATVSAIAERLVREEIERIKASIK
jgi:CheY-like chemotaxis protein